MASAHLETGSSLKWDSHAITNVGRVRKHNEDSVLDRSDIGLWVVADGMGGHAKGDVASQMIIDSMKKLHEGMSLPRFLDDIEDRITEVNKKLINIARQSPEKATIGSTVAMLHLHDKYGIQIWAGDSRIYRLRDFTLHQITTDHSQVELYIEQGLISREEAMIHPHGNMITRAVGATEELFLDMDIEEIKKGDRYMLCSDGLTKHLSDYEIEETLGHGNAEECCKDLIDMTLMRGAGDNVTVVVVDII